MKRKKLSLDEIEQARDKILSEYDHYIVEYMKSRRLKEDFESRYFSAMKARIDMTHFLHAELTAVRELRRKEEERLNSEHNRTIEESSKKRQPKPMGFADRIVAENREKIAKYPAKEIHPDASFEVSRLFGVLNDFERRYWPEVERCMRKISPTLYSGPRIVLERKIFDLWSDTKDGVSPRLASYVSLFFRFPRSQRDIAREEQRFLVDSGYLMHEVADEIGLVKDNNALDEDERKFLDKMFDYVHTVINDFRLNDFKAQ